MRSSISLVIIISVFEGEGKLYIACPCLFFVFLAKAMMKKTRKHNKMKKRKKEKKTGRR
jgi:hypothetical protein